MPSTGTPEHRGAPEHHGSHWDLLWTADPQAAAPEGIDAIIVPTARRPAYLAEAAKLAQALDCTLATLHSKQWTSASGVAQRLPQSVDLIAIDLPERAQLRLPDWETSRLLRGTVFARRTDVSAKRNLGLLGYHISAHHHWPDPEPHLSPFFLRQTEA